MIFSGIEILFFTLGILTQSAVVISIYYHRRLKFDWKTWLMLGMGSFLLIFCIAWSCSSVLEGEPRAASMGMIVFGLPALIFLVLGRKLALKKVV
ncbi:MAG: hypothetical protein ACEPOZ_20595 [Marinifilaceae bacterium]